MDMCMADVTDVPGVRTGDIATILGEDGDERLLASEQTAPFGGIPNDILCSIGRRVPRVYLRGGKVVGRRDGLL